MIYTDDLLIKLAQTVAEELTDDWHDLLPYAHFIKDPDEYGNYHTDVNGIPLNTRDDVNVYYLPSDDSDVVASRFIRTNNILSEFTGYHRNFIAIIGPNSVIPKHIDDSTRKPFSFSKTCNFLLGIKVPSEDPNQLGFSLNNKIIGQKVGSAVAFDANIPHEAWNKTNEWWIALSMVVDKHRCKLGKYLYK